MDGATTRQQRERLAEVLRDCGSVCIGYTGGVDSVFLAATAVEVLGPERVLAVTGRSPAYPAIQHRMALECAEHFGIPHFEVETRELDDPRYAANPTNRCYYCKTELWDRLLDVALDRGLKTVVDGSNIDDDADHRPGARAAAERGVRSPLREAGLTKAAIRSLSRAMGLPTWDQPASPCLASRLAYGIGVTPARLAQVERAEALLRDAGLRELRVRHHGDIARVEVAGALDARSVVESAVPELLELGFEQVVLDVEGYRRGALNEGLVKLGGAGGGDRNTQRIEVLSRLLNEAGLDRRVELVGAGAEIAAVRCPRGADRALAELAPRIRALGVQYVAVALGQATTDDEDT